ncbi:MULTISPECIES: helix-turn-helix transcriptional regulator [unclassified Rhodococcus (in: high G+C Gram-positive bacteria)]|uniref:helix-turn-helix transcriptional regulator n=1 Tax=unclassified Rhodococcus (in: high G+C Gram-positive bacteria) TaxID=192944 RepID=UPI00096AAFCC|nr:MULTISPECIES: helix-turn-helix domain-containing protein [unclassified Rhodococcus (in: high G+C Gram-positive bacteria)]
MAIRKGTGSARADTHAVLASGRRVQLLDALRAAAESMAASELADLCGLHVSTVRFHLNALIEVGLIAKETERNVIRGRPRQLYRAQNPLGSGVGITSGYEKLAHVLAAHFARHADGDPEQLAEAAGRQWALDDLGETSGNGRSTEDAAVVVTTLFAEMGFDPELESSTSDTRIRLHACPFESVARQNPGVVCSLHLGLIRGVLTRLGARQIESTLTPWDTAHTCLAQLEQQ